MKISPLKPTGIVISHHFMPRGTRGLSLAGFTIIELLASIAIIAVLVSLLLTGWKSLQGKARWPESTAKLKNISVACNSFIADSGYYPSMTKHYPSTIDAWGGVVYEHYHRQLGDKDAAPTALPPAHAQTIWTDLVPYMDGDPSPVFMRADPNRLANVAPANWQTSPYMWVDASFVFRWGVLLNEANVSRRALLPTDFAFPSKQIIFHERAAWTLPKVISFYAGISPIPINALYADGHVALIRNCTPATFNFFNTNLPGASNPLINLQESWDEY